MEYSVSFVVRPQTRYLKSVAGDEFIFKNKPAKVESLKLLEDEVYKIKTELERI